MIKQSNLLTRSRTTFVYVLRVLFSVLMVKRPIPKSNHSTSRFSGVSNSWGAKMEVGTVDASSPITVRGFDAVPWKLLKIVSKTRVAIPHFSVRPKLRRARRSLDVVTSSVLGKIRRRKIWNIPLLIVGETNLTNSANSCCWRQVVVVSRYSLSCALRELHSRLRWRTVSEKNLSQVRRFSSDSCVKSIRVPTDKESLNCFRINGGTGPFPTGRRVGTKLKNRCC